MAPVMQVFQLIGGLSPHSFTLTLFNDSRIDSAPPAISTYEFLSGEQCFLAIRCPLDDARGEMSLHIGLSNMTAP